MTDFLIPNRPPKKKVRSIDEIIAEAKRKDAQNPTEITPKAETEVEEESDITEPTGSIDFSIQKISEGYRINGVKYLDDNYTIDFKEEFLPAQTLDQFAEQAKKAGKKDYRAASAPTIYAICSTLYTNRNGKHKAIIEELRSILEKAFKEYWINTLSRAEWNPSGTEDEIIHEYKQKNQYSKRGNFVGKDDYITKKAAKAKEYVQAVFDTSDSPKQVNNIFKWITKKNSYALRFNNKPENKEVRAVVLGVSNIGGFFIDTYFDIIDRPAFGVRRKNFSTCRENKRIK